MRRGGASPIEFLVELCMHVEDLLECAACARSGPFEGVQPRTIRPMPAKCMLSAYVPPAPIECAAFGIPAFSDSTLAFTTRTFRTISKTGDPLELVSNDF